MKNKNIKLGIFFTGGLIILIVTLFVVGSRQNLFESSIVLRANFSDAMGLQEGSSVRYVGITIGSVDQIAIINDTCVAISMKINKSQAQFITKTAKAEISSDGLMGNKLITIVPGIHSLDPVQNGDELATLTPIGMENIMNSVLENSRNLEVLSGNLIDITEKISGGEGLVGRLLFDTAVNQKFDDLVVHTEQLMSNLQTTTSNISAITGNIENGQGTLGKLIKDESIANGITKIIDSLALVTHNMNNATNEIEKFSIKLNNGDGSLSRLVNDAAMAKNLNSTIVNAKDRSAELEETIEIVNDSWILNLFSGKKKKRRQKERQENQPGTEPVKVDSDQELTTKAY